MAKAYGSLFAFTLDLFGDVITNDELKVET